MHKKVLSEIALYYGEVSMPQNFEIQRGSLILDGVESELSNTKLKFSREWDKLTTYVIEHINIKYNLTLINKDTWINIYKPNEQTIPLLNVNPVNLYNSPDFTLLYGLKTNDCVVRVHYDNNRRKGRSWDINLTDNKFIMFPSTCMYYLKNNQKEELNYVQTITYTLIER